jgi:DNA-binding LytR/AlgR family response regulator
MSLNEKLIIPSQDHLHLIDSDQIMYCKSDNSYTHININGEKEIVVAKSLARFSRELDPKWFIRVNQSFLINIRFIKLINKKKRFIELVNQQQIPFTVRIKELIELLSPKDVLEKENII